MENQDFENILQESALPKNDQQQLLNNAASPASSGVRPKTKQRHRSGPAETRNRPSYPPTTMISEETRARSIRRVPSETNLSFSPPILAWNDQPGGPPHFKKLSTGGQTADSAYQVDASVDDVSESMGAATLSETSDYSHKGVKIKPSVIPQEPPQRVPNEPQQTGPILLGENRKKQQVFKTYLERVKTEFQQRLLGLFLNKESKGRQRNAMFAMFEVHDVYRDRLLHYNHYVNQGDNMHSEAFLLQDLGNIQRCIDRQMYEIDLSGDRLQDLKMAMLSKNSPCSDCAPLLIEFVETYNKRPKNYGLPIPKLSKLSVQYLVHYRSDANTDKGLKILREYSKTTGFDIEIKPLDHKQFYALFVQWSYTRLACKTYSRPCSLDDTDITADDIYYQVLSDPNIRNRSDADIDDELARLVVETSEEELKRREIARKACRDFLSRCAKD